MTKKVLSKGGLDHSHDVKEFEKVTVPEKIELQDLYLKVATYQNDVQGMVAAIKDLGKNMYEQNQETQRLVDGLIDQMCRLNEAFVGVAADNADIRTLLKNVPLRNVAPKQEAVLIPKASLSESELDSIRWTDSKGEYGGQWAFRFKKGTSTVTPEAVKLVEAIINGGGKIKLYGRGYKFSGENGMFIARTDKK